MIQIEGLQETKHRREFEAIGKRLDELESSIEKIEKAIMVLGQFLHNLEAKIIEEE